MEVGLRACCYRRVSLVTVANCCLWCRLPEESPTFRSGVLPVSGAVTLFLPDAQGGGDFLVCWKMWDMAAANVACREHGHRL